MSILSRIFGKTGNGKYEELVAQSIEELRLKTSAHDATWNLAEANWTVDQDRGFIVFTSPNGVKATGTVQIIGTFNTDDNTWLWAWDHPSVVPALQEHAKRVRAYGQKNGIERLTTRKFQCEESQAWEFTAVACKLSEAQGGYRGPAGSALVFMTFSDVKLST